MGNLHVTDEVSMVMFWKSGSLLGNNSICEYNKKILKNLHYDFQKVIDDTTDCSA